MRNDRFVSRLTKNTLALIMAGGRGSRLGELTRWHAKPAVPFGGKFRIIDFPLSNCMNSGIRKIGVITQYKAHSLIRHLQKGWGFLRGEFDEFVELMPAQQRLESSWYKGTADSVFQNLDIIHDHQPTHVLILAADHIYKMDYGPMLAWHVENNADLTVGCIEVPLSEASAFGVMAIDGQQRVRDFQEKPGQPASLPGDGERALVSMGIYVFSTEFLEQQLMEDAGNPDSEHDFGKNIIPEAIHKHRVFAFPFRDQNAGQAAYWRDVGTIDAYWKASLELVDVTPELNLYDKDWPIWTYQEQSPACKFVFDDDDRRGMAVDSIISGGSIISGATIRHSLISYNVTVNSWAEVNDTVVLNDVSIGRHSRIRRAVIDNGVQIPENTVIGEDPEADRQRFHVTPGGVVLVTGEMLGQKLRFDASFSKPEAPAGGSGTVANPHGLESSERVS